jgi:methionyl-tRNA synthetase
LNKTDKTRMGTVLRVLVDTMRVIATLLQPFMPGSMANMLDQLGVPVHARTIEALAAPLADGIQLPAPRGVFPRYVEPAA